jgi:ribosome-associated translation inhibitor RaiA
LWLYYFLDKEDGPMPDSSRFTIICPCYETNLTVDAQTGVLISHEEKAKPVASFDEMVKGLDKQKQMREQIFAQELSSMKDRDRILEEKFQEAMKRAEKDKDKPYRNPLDID